MMEVTKVWWDGNKIMAEPVDPASVYSDIVSDGGMDPRNTTPPSQEPVTWGVDWGRAGQAPCATIIKRLHDGRIEVVAVEYGPERTWQGLTPEETLEEAHKEEQVSGFIHGVSWASFKLRERNK